MANPDSRHYWDHDVFTYVSALPNPEKNKDTATFRSKLMREGDSLFYSKGYIILEKLVTTGNIPVKGFQPGDKATAATLRVHSFNKTSYAATPLLIDQKGTLFSVPDTVISESLVLRINKTKNNRADIGLKESSAVLEYVTLKAYKFPFINILWAGIIITAIGILMSMVRRIRMNRNSQA